MTVGLQAGTQYKKQEPTPYQSPVPARTTSNSKSHCSALHRHDNRKFHRLQGDNSRNIRKSHRKSSNISAQLQLWPCRLSGSAWILPKTAQDAAGHDCSAYSSRQMQRMRANTCHSSGTDCSVFTDPGRPAAVHASLFLGKSGVGIAHAGKQ